MSKSMGIVPLQIIADSLDRGEKKLPSQLMAMDSTVSYFMLKEVAAILATHPTYKPPQHIQTNMRIICDGLAAADPENSERQAYVEILAAFSEMGLSLPMSKDEPHLITNGQDEQSVVSSQDDRQNDSVVESRNDPNENKTKRDPTNKTDRDSTNKTDRDSTNKTDRDSTNKNDRDSTKKTDREGGAPLMRKVEEEVSSEEEEEQPSDPDKHRLMNSHVEPVSSLPDEKAKKSESVKVIEKEKENSASSDYSNLSTGLSALVGIFGLSAVVIFALDEFFGSENTSAGNDAKTSSNTKSESWKNRRKSASKIKPTKK
eukprot:GHVP01027323.1.p1 GENE.GHVP01027323.1~~GHVP01027323.1.p1  ORF type:complete len:316 (-),score=78.36 GHVP01027323.1:57-1004(-)